MDGDELTLDELITVAAVFTVKIADVQKSVDSPQTTEDLRRELSQRLDRYKTILAKVQQALYNNTPLAPRPF